MAIIALLLMVSCQHQSDNYSSIQDFFSKNGVPMQTYTINGTTGGSFTTPQGTVVTIPPNAFVTQASVPVTGDVTIEFKDIYKKSDMLLSNVTTDSYYGPLSSCGEFYMKASFNNSAVLLASGKKIEVTQPNNLTYIDTLGVMGPYIATPSDTMVWIPSNNDSVFYTPTAYIYNLYQFNSPIESGGWFNGDSPYPFLSCSQTMLTLIPSNNLDPYHIQVFLMFTNYSSATHLHYYGSSFIYYYAPIGLQCTMVAFGIKDGKLYSSFVPITIGTNQTYNFTLSETTTAEFKTQLEALN